MKEKRENFKIPSFSVILIMVILMVIGAAMLPKLNIQYSPRSVNTNISVWFSYGGASSRVVEQEVTSKIEGALNSLEGVINISATSYQGSGSVTLTFKKGTKMEAARYNVATQIRQIYDKLPEGVSYPSINSSISGNSNSMRLLSYTINADMPADRIVNYAQEAIVTPLARIEGVESVRTSGAQPFEWLLTFDPNSLRAVGLSPADLSAAFNEYFRNSIVGSSVIGERLMLVKLRTEGLDVELERIPVKMVNGRLFYLGDFAKVSYQEQLPSYYSRYNGLNTINLDIQSLEGVNSIEVAKSVRNKMEELKDKFPERFTIQLNYDASIQLKKEINKIFKRSIFSLLFLLSFVLLVSRNFKYLSVIALAITANLLVAVIFYYVLNVDIEIFSMAGITVSLGIIIDSSIVMVDHYSYYKNKTVALSITGAMLTTIAALMIIFFLPDNQKRDLIDFVWVIIINLSLSLVIAFLFIPSLLDKIKLNSNGGVMNTTYWYKRKLVNISGKYERYISWGRAHRWIFIVVIILGFGLPIRILPSQVTHKGTDNKEGGLVGLYNQTIGSKWYQKNKEYFEKTLGGAFNYFSKNLNSATYYRQPEPSRELRVNASMPEGCNAQQMNAVIVEMENWLSQFDEIESYRTSVNGASGDIIISFKKEFERGSFPYNLKQNLWSKACGYGGATWYVSALDENDRSLSNNVYTTSFDHSIPLFGYNYDILYRYAEDLIDTLLTNKRVTAAGLHSGSYFNSAGSEYFLNFDREKIVRNGLNIGKYYSFLGQQLYDNRIGNVFDGEENTSVRLVSSERDYFDLWHITNDMIDIDSVPTRMSDVGTVTKRSTAINISRNNQEYVLNVGYNFVGSWDQSTRMSEDRVKTLNKTMPMGFRAGSGGYYWSDSEKQKQALLILVVVIIIFMICSIIYESLVKPLVIILMIPLGLAGLFISFPLIGVNFDQGGFAAIVMLCGIVVNAGIYIMSELNTVSYKSRTTPLRRYIKAYNRKIVPTMLTIISTVLGLIPFLFDGREEVFWFAFAIGVMGGMTFSIIAITFFLPIFMPLKKEKN